MTADTGLPIEAVIPDVLAALAGPGRCVLQAEPGAGKTTVVPLRVLPEPWLAGQTVLVLEPRRLAARAAARRMADLMGESVGQTVGVVTRDYRKVGQHTRIEVITEGILTRRLQNDPSLAGVGLVIFDEFHERNIQGDLGLALLLDARRGLDLSTRIMVMSATLDGERVAELLDDGGDAATPIVTSEGRTFPIDVEWRPRVTTGKRKQWIEPAAADAIRYALDTVPEGDVLVFLPGMGEIRRTANELGSMGGVDIHLLHGSLPMDEQDAAVAPGRPGRRKVVLSTDIAETSLTVEGVRVVVDSGLARAPRFDTRTGMTRLVTVSTSRASAEQRAGRAGRLAPGTAIRLWSKMEHGTRDRFTPAEISQIDLADLVLELRAWGVDDPASLPFIDEPPKRALDEANDLLRMLGALDSAGGLTSTGRQMVSLPLHPRLGRMIVGANERGLGWTACLLASLLDERDVLRGRPDELPADLGLRLDLLDDSTRRHPLAAGRSLAMARDRARDLARRISVDTAAVDRDRAGMVLALAYPDRVGQRRGESRGRFRLRSGSGAWVRETDPLANEQFIVAADLDGKRNDARIRMGAGLDGDDLTAAFASEVEVKQRLRWDKSRNDLVSVTERRLGSLDLGSITARPEPSPEATELLLQRVRDTQLKVLTWTDTARALQHRVEFLRRELGDGWPDVSDKALLASVDEWLPPYLPGATGRADLEIVSLSVVLDSMVESAPGRREGERARDLLARLTPDQIELPSGRKVRVDYGAERPTIGAKVQEFFGLTMHPTILDGALPLTIELRSPADRPIQVTADLPGFWAGSWAEVRKDMAGRYPKHQWPADPATAKPKRY